MTPNNTNTATLAKTTNPKHERHQAMLQEHREAKEARRLRSRTYSPGWHKANGEICADKSINWVPKSAQGRSL